MEIRIQTKTHLCLLHAPLHPAMSEDQFVLKDDWMTFNISIRPFLRWK